VTPRKLSVAVADFPYGGNGQWAKEAPEVGDWIRHTCIQAISDSRVAYFDTVNERWEMKDGKVEVATMPTSFRFCDTPITMTRNAAVHEALRRGIDVLLMVDSDQVPDIYVGQEPDAVRFWDAAFNFIYDHWDKGPVCVGAPYMGCPPHENVFVFTWANFQSDHPNMDFKLRQYTREEASQMSGIHECAALPTGLIAFDTRLFDLTKPQPDQFKARVQEWFRGAVGKELTQQMVDGFAERCAMEKWRAEQSWFYYEYTDRFQHHKASTEDVTATRDLSLAGKIRLGYNPVHCAWNSWAGHIKPKCVGKPRPITVDILGPKLIEAAKTSDLKCVELKLGG